MTDSPDKDNPAVAKPWSEKVWLVAAGVIVALSVYLVQQTAGGIVSGDKTSAVLATQVQALREDIKDQNSDQKDTKRILQEIVAKQYTREEARADREAAERRFLSLEGRIGDLGRRIEIVEANQRFMQQFVIDKPGPGRRAQ